MSLPLFLWLIGAWFTYGFIRDDSDTWIIRAIYVIVLVFAWPVILGRGVRRKMNQR